MSFRVTRPRASPADAEWFPKSLSDEWCRHDSRRDPLFFFFYAEAPSVTDTNTKNGLLRGSMTSPHFRLLAKFPERCAEKAGLRSLPWINSVILDHIVFLRSIFTSNLSYHPQLHTHTCTHTYYVYTYLINYWLKYEGERLRTGN